MVGTDKIQREDKFGLIEWNLENGTTQWRTVVVGGCFVHKECGGRITSTSKPTPNNSYTAVCERCGETFIIPDLWAGE